ncbi:MAG: acyl-CoA thioesterase [Rouxiella aceris]|uniref:acyl-CoA thioesterase n=1 Tax=Rouxiella aceris TaxID=2703884 RepID=UPI00284C517C|nr:acyl-CoA thioesterase [Rouxiella aceris]MDR3433254.1 acyl-CoA thioesterase [Rouxiella aceris]
MEGKTVQDSALAMSVVMQPNQANPAGNVHGGEIMKLMDNAAFVVAQRHARSNVVTARVDELVFHQPVYIGNLVTCHAFLTFVSRSSMEVLVTVEVENLYSEASGMCALMGYFTMVALNAGGQPSRVSPLELTSDAERTRFEAGSRRHEDNRRKKHDLAVESDCLVVSEAK